jgi:hypothetical protein
MPSYADAMDQAIAQMTEARAIAEAAGLTVTDAVIQDPPASAEPGKGGPGYRHIQDQPGHAADVAVRQAKIDAYKRAEQKVLTGRDIQKRAEEELQKWVSAQWEKAWITAPSMIASYTRGHLKGNVKWHELAAKNAGVADTASKLLNDPYLTPQARAKLIGIVDKYRVDSWVPEDPARTNSAAAQAIDKLPKTLQAPLLAELKLGPEGFRAGFPGLALSTVSVVTDLAQGKDPGKTIGTSAGSTVAGVIAGGVISTFGGGPILVTVGGTVVGNAVATGLGWVYDEIKSGEHPAYTTPDGQYRTPPMSR